jgi:hypothetical protein
MSRFLVRIYWIKGKGCFHMDWHHEKVVNHKILLAEYLLSVWPIAK